MQTSLELGWTALELRQTLLGQTLLGLVKEWAWLGVVQKWAMLGVALAPSLGVKSSAGAVVSAAGAAVAALAGAAATASALQCSWVAASA